MLLFDRFKLRLSMAGESFTFFCIRLMKERCALQRVGVSLIDMAEYIPR